MSRSFECMKEVITFQFDKFTDGSNTDKYGEKPCNEGDIYMSSDSAHMLKSIFQAKICSPSRCRVVGIEDVVDS